MLFGEYELSPSLIGLSLLPTTHQITWFRVYRRQLYALFRLAFASAACIFTLNLADDGNS